MIPYGRQTIEDDDIEAVTRVLRGDWLTTGPMVDEFEAAVSSFVGRKYGVAVANGTAALHVAMHAAGIGPGDEVITTPITFAATSNSVLYCGATPVFADVCADTLLIDPDSIEKKITPRTKAIAPVDYAGQPCDFDRLEAIAKKHGLLLIVDACHSLGGHYKAKPAGGFGDMAVFSFHPVKQITTGEGGLIVTDDEALYKKMRSFRNHGITTDHRQRAQQGAWFYEMVELGYNYRITDIQCALGFSQLKKLPRWIERRQEIAARYDAAFSAIDGIDGLSCQAGVSHAYHLYVVRIDREKTGCDRQAAFMRMREAGIGVNVHYVPVHYHPYYRQTLGTGAGDCPVAEAAYEEILSLPIYPGLTDEQVDEVVRALTCAVGVNA